MRELKFRIWDNSHNEFIRPDYGLIGFCYPLDGRIAVLTANSDPIEDCDIEQYTGLKDKNGKDIYEGDVVDVISPTKLRGVEEHKIWVCRFGIKRAGFVLNRETNSRIFSLTFGEINAKNIAVEVIGNIHENADLLEGKWQ